MLDVPKLTNMVVECLRDLADRSFQERVWIRGEGPEVSSFVESVCQLFDDTGLGDLLESGRAGQVLGAEAANELGRLSVLLGSIPEGLDAASLLCLPTWAEVLTTAAKAADLVAGRKAPEGVEPVG